MSSEAPEDLEGQDKVDGENADSKAVMNEKSKPLNKFFDRFRTGLVLSTLLMLFVVTFFWQTVVVFNHPGQQGVYWSRFFGGTSDRYLGEGAHFKFPWDEIAQYDMRLQEAGGDLVLLSKDGMEMDVKWSIRFRPEPNELPELHRALGPDYAHRVVIPEAISSLRQVLGNYRAEEIFAYDEASLVTQLSKNAGHKFDNYPVFVKNILLLQLQLPKDMAEGIVNKLLFEQEMLAYDYRLQAAQHEKDRLKIEAEGLKQFEEISNIPMLQWKGIDATVELAKSPNSKIIVIGTDSKELPLLLNSGK
ncbi:prohibitin family protein [Kordiimonas pumila]|uniref:Prohibitin family protein n=1 Tax=Kordiimonas pumila TaxID=2161677 RepID=A0ABV7D334_9PROT|nr:prohibitin family protein [Kordiimonas pumila]